MYSWFSTFADGVGPQDQGFYFLIRSKVIFCSPGIPVLLFQTFADALHKSLPEAVHMGDFRAVGSPQNQDHPVQVAKEFFCGDYVHLPPDQQDAASRLGTVMEGFGKRGPADHM